MATGTGAYGGTFGSKFELVLESHEVSVDTANNRSLIEITLYMLDVSGGGSDYYDNSGTPWSLSGTISASGDITYNLSGNGQAAYMMNTNEYWITHNNDGTGSVSLSASHNSEDSPYLTTASASLSYSLTPIDQTPAILSFEAINITSTGFELVATTDLSCSVIAFSNNDGGSYEAGGSGTSGNYTFGGLPGGTTYTCICYATDASSGITTYSGTISVTTEPAGGFFDIGY